MNNDGNINKLVCYFYDGIIAVVFVSFIVIGSPVIIPLIILGFLFNKILKKLGFNE